MGLLDLLQNQGSSLTAYDGTTPSINPLATPQSQMHTGYSINGTNASTVNGSYQEYLDGTTNFLPTPSQLDLKGQKPVVPGKLPYLDNLPK